MALRKNIFLLEDEEDDKLLFIETIKGIDSYFKYTVAYDDKDALNKLRILKHLPDLIFININKPGMKGFEFLKLIKAENFFNQIPVIVLSASNGIAEKAYKFGANGFVTKPVSVSKLRAAIEHVLKFIKEII
jgi:CheY-like chemotaxis protein